jgi:hypothetical protein
MTAIVQRLTKLMGKLFAKRRKPQPSATPPTQMQGQPPVSEEEVRKRLEGLGYLE